MVSAERFVGAGGSIRWGALATTLFGSAFLAVALGAIEWVLAFFGILTSSIDGGVRFVISLIDVVFGGVEGTLLAGWSDVRTLVTTSEAFGFVVALAFVLTLLLALRWVASRG